MENYRFQRLFRGGWRVTLLRNRPRSKQQTESEKAYEELEAAYSYEKSVVQHPVLQPAGPDATLCARRCPSGGHRHSSSAFDACKVNRQSESRPRPAVRVTIQIQKCESDSCQQSLTQSAVAQPLPHWLRLVTRGLVRRGWLGYAAARGLF